MKVNRVIFVLFRKRDDSVINIGLYDKESPIRIKILYHGGSQKIDIASFNAATQKAFKKRENLLKTNTNSYRLFFGEKLTADKGILVLASCSSRILADSFFDINQQVLNSTDRLFKVVLRYNMIRIIQ